MKIYCLLTCLATCLITNTACKKEHVASERAIPNTSPVADAGNDLFLWSPLREGEISGSFLDREQNVNAVSWAKVSGPDFYVLGNKNSLKTIISGLQPGIYQFELTVTDKFNAFDRDTMEVRVAEMPENPNQIIFKDLVWIFPWNSNVEVFDFVGNVPPGADFKIYIQREFDHEWKEVRSVTENEQGTYMYDYFIITNPSHDFYNYGSLYISYYGNDLTDTPNVKITY
ncbi:MAG TPA: hypothetical protein VMY77_06290 [Chitinophagaceae bacterium]|nr:hypothetical protein [Chitinophagaceae bacterium]